MTALPIAFRYLKAPESYWWEEKPKTCVICGQSCPGYWFFQLHEDGYNEYHVCEPCLVSGRLAERGLQVNEGDIDGLRDQIRQTRSELSETEREAIVAKRTDEVERRTPQPKILNSSTWPIHCGDYCIFFHQADAEELSRLAPDGNGKAFLSSHPPVNESHIDKAFLDNAWEDRLNGFIRLYLWQCSYCGKYLLTTDSE